MKGAAHLMLDQMLSPIIQSLTRARITVYHVAASLLALATMLSPSLGLSPSDDLESINSSLIPMRNCQILWMG